MENQNIPQNDGFELLKKIIESNNENISQSKLYVRQQTETNGFLKDLFTQMKGMTTIIQKSVNSFPNSITLVNSPQTQESIDSLKELLQKKTLREFFALIMAGLSLLTIIVVSFLAKQWYSESIRTKTEIRQEILDEIKNEGKSIYKVKDYKQLQHNTTMMNKWMDSYPKAGKEFMKFKKGYESR